MTMDSGGTATINTKSSGRPNAKPAATIPSHYVSNGAVDWAAFHVSPLIVNARSIGNKWYGPWLVVGGRWTVGGGLSSTHWKQVIGAQLKTQTKTHRPPTKSHGYIGNVVSTTVKKKSSSKAKKEEKDELIKIVIRRLPPGMGKQELWDQLQPLPANPRAFWFCPANTTEFRPNQTFSRAYIAFHEEKDAIAFAERFNGYVFVDKQGNESMAIVECAPNQHVPRDLDKPAKESDVRSGTLENEAKYLKFLDHYDALAAAGTRRVTNFEDLVRQLEDKERRLAEGQVQETPLTAFIKHHSTEKMVRKNQKHLDRLDKRQQKQQSPFSSSRAFGIANEHEKQPKERKQHKQQREQQLALAGTGTVGVDANKKKKNGRAERKKSKQFGGDKTATDGGVEPLEGTNGGKGTAENEGNQQTVTSSSYSAKVKAEKCHSVDGSKERASKEPEAPAADLNGKKEPPSSTTRANPKEQKRSKNAATKNADADMPAADGEAKKNAAESGQVKRNAKNRDRPERQIYRPGAGKIGGGFGARLRQQPNSMDRNNGDSNGNANAGEGSSADIGKQQEEEQK